MRLEATHPGRNGDILWALPTVRAIAAAYGEPVHLTIPAQYGSLSPLLAQQAYIGSVLAREDWVVEQTAPITPRVPPQWGTVAKADRTFHLGYVGWPSPTLPEDVYERCVDDAKLGDGVELPALDLTTPWLTALRQYGRRKQLAIGFTDEHFELKYGITELVIPEREQTYWVGQSDRWALEGQQARCSWEFAACAIADSQVFFGCCSALHVLAVGLGIPAVVMEPNPHRLNPVFWPLGQDGPQVRLVRGNDGQATFDARACAEVLREVLNDV